jgi:hypothetical protein
MTTVVLPLLCVLCLLCNALLQPDKRLFQLAFVVRHLLAVKVLAQERFRTGNFFYFEFN